MEADQRQGLKQQAHTDMSRLRQLLDEIAQNTNFVMPRGFTSSRGVYCRDFHPLHRMTEVASGTSTQERAQVLFILTPKAHHHQATEANEVARVARKIVAAPREYGK